jgi:hypothetical protein
MEHPASTIVKIDRGEQKISFHICGNSGAKSHPLYLSWRYRSLRMAKKVRQQPPEEEAMAAAATDLMEGVDEVDGHLLHDEDYTSRMLARRRIEIMKDEKELQKLLDCFDWPEESAFQQ